MLDAGVVDPGGRDISGGEDADHPGHLECWRDVEPGDLGVRPVSLDGPRVEHIPMTDGQVIGVEGRSSHVQDRALVVQGLAHDRPVRALRQLAHDPTSAFSACNLSKDWRNIAAR